MEYRIAERMKAERNSVIREVAAKGKTIPDFHPLEIGNPADESIPVEILQQCAVEIIQKEPLAVLKYGPIEGDEPLKRWILNRLATKKGIQTEGNQIMMVAGSGKALGYVPRALCDPEDEVYFERFSYPNAQYSVMNVGSNAVAIPSDQDGMLPDELEKRAKNGKGKYIYLVPNFQNPTGATMPLTRRREIYEIAKKYELVIYEDDPYGEIRFAGTDIPSFKSIDTEGLVVYAGSFSKTLSAGLRVGFTLSGTALDKKLKMVRGGDGQDAIYTQMIVRKCLEKIDYDEHLQKISKIYGEKCDFMAEQLQQHLPKDFTFRKPEGGMFIWVDAPASIDIDAFSDACIRAGVGLVKSEAFAVDASDPGTSFRLNFSAPTKKVMQEGIEILGRVARQYV